MGYVPARLRYRYRCLKRAVPSAHDEYVPAFEVLRVVESVIYLVLVLTRHAQHPEVPGAPDPHYYPERLEALFVGDYYFDETAPVDDLLDPLDFRLYAPPERLFLYLFDKRLFYFLRELEVACGDHVRRVRVYVFSLREIHDGRKGLGGFEYLEPETVSFRFERGGHTGDAGPDYHEVEYTAVPERLTAFEEPLVPEYVHHRPGPGIGGEFQERYPGEVSGYVESGDVRRVVLFHLRQLLDNPRGPLGVEPPGVSFYQSEHLVSSVGIK